MKTGWKRLQRTDVLFLIALAAVLVSVAVAARAPRVGLGDRAQVIEAQLRCPTCQGLSIADSPATSATQMRALVREQLAAGASDDAVRAFFVARYGRWILLDPPVAGLDLFLWLMPLAIVILGSLVVVRRAMAGRSATSPPDPGRGSPGHAGRLVTALVYGGMVLALVVPIGAAVLPRLAGAEVSGQQVLPSAPSIAELEAFVAAEPANVEVLMALATRLLESGQIGEAAARFQAVLELDPNNVTALLGVGSILLGADQPVAASAAFDRVLRLVVDQPDALLYRAIARLRVGGRAGDPVQRDLRRFLEVALPNDPRRATASAILSGSSEGGPSSSAPASGAPERP